MKPWQFCMLLGQLDLIMAKLSEGIHQQAIYLMACILLVAGGYAGLLEVIDAYLSRKD